jgi:hypothetical protein
MRLPPLTASGFRPVPGSNAMGNFAVAGPDGQRIIMTRKDVRDYGPVSHDLLAVLAALAIQPVASGKYGPPARVTLGPTQAG